MTWSLLFLLSFTGSGGDFLVVTSVKTEVETLSEIQVRSIYLGKLDRVNTSPVQFINLRKKDPSRLAFEAALFKKGFDLEDYWLSQRLLNQASPPLEVGSWALVLAYLQRNPGLIGFLDSSREEELAKWNLKVLARIRGDTDP